MLCLLLPAAEADDSDEYRSGEDDDADNEATIEEEEALAAAEGRNVKVRRRGEASEDGSGGAQGERVGWCVLRQRGRLARLPLCVSTKVCCTSSGSGAAPPPLGLSHCTPAHPACLSFPPCLGCPPPPQIEEADELAGLDEEAELPLEQLLARYGNYHLAAAAGGEESAGREGREGWQMVVVAAATASSTT